MGRILVTGATGTVGRHAVALLREAGAEVVALSGGDGDLRDPGTLPPLDGVTSALLVWPFATADGARDVLRALAGRRVVYLSSAARREGEREVERLVEEMAGEWTFLRPHAFAANALRWARQVRAGVVRGAHGAAGMPVVHERDIAAVAVRALLDAGHHGAAYTLTGPETLTQADQVRVISEVTRLPVRWEELSPEHARDALAAEGWPPGVAEEVLRAQAELVSRPLPVTSAVEEVTKAPARSFREWVREHADAFLWAPGGSRTGTGMRAARIHEFGDASVIRLDEVPIPRPGPGEVLLEVAATSFNPSEVGLRSGLLPEVFRASLPHTLGWDVSGTVVETGAGVSGLAPGDRVFGMADGAAAEYVVAPAGALARAPRSIPLADAAAVPVAGLTAWQAVHEHARLTPGQRVLVNGAGGGVGMFAVQLAKLAGAHVTATASPRSAAAVRRLGADEVIDYTTTPLPADVDVLLNLIPNGPAGQSRTTVSIAGGEGHFVMRYDPDDLAALATLIDDGGLAVEIAESHPLPELAQIHQRAEAGDIRGKITFLMA